MSSHSDTQRTDTTDVTITGASSTTHIPRPSITPAIGAASTLTIAGIPNPRIIVTRAAGGIGAAIAAHLHALGADVIATDRLAHPTPTEDLTVTPLDLADIDSVEEFLADQFAQGRIHGLVNAAGLLLSGAAEVITAADFDALWAVNTRVVYALATRCGAHMVAYGATKAAASMLTRSLGLELGRAGVRCNVISPGTCRTRMICGLGTEEELVAGVPADYKAGIPLGKIAEPRDIAHTSAFLLSDAAGHITCQDLIVDGGASAH